MEEGRIHLCFSEKLGFSENQHLSVLENNNFSKVTNIVKMVYEKFPNNKN